MNPKRRKIEEPLSGLLVKKEIVLLDLNDNCIFKIFNWLALKDLGVLCQTCEHLRKLATNFFKQRYTEKVHGKFSIERTEWRGEWKTRMTSDGVDSFTHCIQNMEICDMYNGVDNNDLIPFIRSHCGESLKTIKFHSGYICPSFGQFIKDILKNVETISFSFCLRGTNFYDSVLQHCENMKRLILKDHGRSPIEDILSRKYSKLEHFECHYDGDFKVEALKDFLLKNPNIKSFHWEFYYRSTDPIEYIKCIADNANNIEEAKFYLHSSLAISIVMCGSKQFKRLRFCIADEEKLNQFLAISSPSLEELYYGKTKLCSVIPHVKSLSNLKLLRFMICGNKYQMRLSEKDFPKLEELRLSFYGPIPSGIIDQFVLQTVNLKTIRLEQSLNDHDVKTVFDIAMWNAERKRLPGACALTVFVSKSCKNIKLNARYKFVKITKEIYPQPFYYRF